MLTNKTLSNSYVVEVNEDLLEIQAAFGLADCQASSVGIKIRGINNEETLMCYNLNEQKLLFDCTHSGKEDGVRKVALQAGKTLALRIFVDRSSIEVFANEGQATMTSRIYPTESRLGIELFTEGGDVIVKELTYWNLKDIWG